MWSRSTTIESTVYNGFTNDVGSRPQRAAADRGRRHRGEQRHRRPVQPGGETAAQVVTNYDSHFWFPGSFRSATAATGAPVADHAFAGVCYIAEPLANPPTNQSVVVEARDQSDTVVPGTLYVRRKPACGALGRRITAPVQATLRLQRTTLLSF